MNMSPKHILTLVPIAIILAGCATVAVPPYIGPPEQVQAEVSVLAAVAKPYIPSSDYPKIHTFANALATATTINSTLLISLVPHTGHPKTDALISAAAAFISLALSHYSSSDPVSLAYCHAVGNALLISFP